jgi:hypothetical protein
MQLPMWPPRPFALLSGLASSIRKYRRRRRFHTYDRRSVSDLDFVPDASPHLVVSLTTIPSRIGCIKPTLISLLQQSRRPGVVEINLARRPLKHDIPWRIPPWLTALNAVRVRWLPHDFGPASKLIPTLQRYGKTSARIVVVDDDMLYSPRLIESFLRAERQFSNQGECVLCVNGYLLPRSGRFDKGHSSDRRIRHGIRRVGVVEGCGGYMLKADHLVYEDLTNTTHAPQDCLQLDDNWISGHLSRRGIAKYQVPLWGRRHSLPQAETPAIVVERSRIANELMDYFKNDWQPEEFDRGPGTHTDR